MRTRKVEIFTFILPGLIFLVLFSLYPTLFTWYTSFRDYSVFSNSFNGLRNYIDLFKDNVFYISLKNTLFYVVFAVSFEFVMGMAIALLFNQSFKGKSIALIFFMLPMIIPPVVSALSFLMMYDPTLGLMNYVLKTLFHISGATWLTDPKTAIWAVVSIDIWQWTPFVTLVLLAGLQYLPKETMEAARIDGANSIQIFFSITLKLMRKIIMIALLFRTVEAFKAFESIFITTKGGPGYNTRTLNIFAYLKGFEFMKFGEAATLAIVMLFVSSLLITVLRKFFSKEEIK